MYSPFSSEWRKREAIYDIASPRKTAHYYGFPIPEESL
jgi:hypothetical protein